MLLLLPQNMIGIVTPKLEREDLATIQKLKLKEKASKSGWDCSMNIDNNWTSAAKYSTSSWFNLIDFSN